LPHYNYYSPNPLPIEWMIVIESKENLEKL